MRAPAWTALLILAGCAGPTPPATQTAPPEKTLAAQEGLPDGEAEDAAKLEEAMAVYRRFPPPKWGPHVLKRLMKGSVMTMEMMRVDNQDFVLNYDLWALADRHVKAKKAARKR